RGGPRWRISSFALSGLRDSTDSIINPDRFSSRGGPAETKTAGRARRFPACRGALHERHDQQRDDVDDLDERIDRGASRVLVGIAHGVARDRSLVRVRALAPVVAFFDVL